MDWIARARIDELEDRVSKLEQKDRRHHQSIGARRVIKLPDVNNIGKKLLIIQAEKEGIKRRSKNKQK